MRRQALITGGAGFLGRHFADQLQSEGWDVMTVDVRNVNDPFSIMHATQAKTSRLHVVRDLREFLDDNTRQEEATLAAYRDDPWDLVIHCAARNPHRQAIDTEPLNLAYNVGLDTAVFNWAARAKPRHLVYISSSAVYPIALQKGVDSDMRLREDFAEPSATSGVPQQPDGPYGWTKYVGELMADAYRQVNGNITVVRPFSGYAEDQSLDFPFNALINRVMINQGAPVTIWGNPHQQRDWIHVDDVVRGTLAAVEARVTGPINLCTGRGTSMAELVTLAGEVVGRPDIRWEGDSSKPMGVMYRVGHPTRFFDVYQPEVSLVDGIRRAVAHWRTKHGEAWKVTNWSR
jgi:nucleoside-diphosphate-sugar epimerase